MLVETHGEPTPAITHATASPGGYYSDSPERPGRWRGSGAEDLGETVGTEQFTRVLLGQDSVTGAQLIAASGFAGRAKNHARAKRPGPAAEPLPRVATQNRPMIS